MKKIDCHTHIINEKIRDEYFSKTDGYAIVMQFLPKFCNDEIKDNSIELVKNDGRLFLSPVVDISMPIKPQLDRIEKIIDEKTVGLKVFLSYQTGKANDERLFPMYDFANDHRLSVTFHTGSCALQLPSDNDIDGSNAKYIAEVAKKYPDVNFIVAHMDDPRFDECMLLLKDNPNMYTDFCGAYEPGYPEFDNIDWAIGNFAKAINQYPGSYKQILYGTDFCPPINLTCIDEYDRTIEGIFTADKFDDIYFNNCLNAFPKIKEYFNKKDGEIK